MTTATISADRRIDWLFTAGARARVLGGGPHFPRGRALPGDLGRRELELDWEDAVSSVIYLELPAHLTRNPGAFIDPEGALDEAHLVANARLRAGQRMLDALYTRRRMESIDAAIEEAAGPRTLHDVLPAARSPHEPALLQRAAVELGLERLDRSALCDFVRSLTGEERELYRLRSCEALKWSAVAQRLGMTSCRAASARMRQRFSRLIRRAPGGIDRFFAAGSCPCRLGDECPAG